MIHLGDCIQVLRTLPDASVDAVVTDPPYELGFMGKSWDNAGIAYNVDLWRQALRVLKPGGHLLAFGGTRTYHRMACAIEDAGFDIRDSLHWIYGCLSEDTEILVNGEWVHYRKAIEGSLALCYDAAHDTYAWQPIEQLYVYAYDDIAYRIESDATDQLVSRNHRCLVERDGKWQFVVAEEVARQSKARVPVLEALPALLDAIRVRESNAGGTQPLLPVLSCDEAQSAEGKASLAQDGANPLYGVRGIDAEAAGVAQEGEAPHLFAEVQRDASRGRVGEARAQGTFSVDRGFSEGVAGADAGREQSGVEGRGDVQAEQGQLRRPEVRPLPDSVFAHGSEGRLRHGASAGSGEDARPMSYADGSGTSHRPQHAEQRARELDAVRVESGPQAVRGEGFTGSTLARVTPTHYVGTVWCVKVPTGAFVARRNGKVFVTGNSGFPKSLDVSKAIDKAAGAEREVVGSKLGLPGYHLSPHDGGEALGHGLSSSTYETRLASSQITAPATDAARQWSGWGTALKPAHEPVVVARKPLVGTVAANVQQHGTGALNIDGCRVATTDSLNGGAYSAGKKADGEWGSMHNYTGAEFKQPDGRWPPNILLSHTSECGETCAEDCAVAEMDRQSGTLKSGSRKAGVYATQGYMGAEPNMMPAVHGDSGGASRFFPVFKYQAKASRSERERGLNEGQKASHPTVKPVELMRWLVRLVTPPRGVVLDPFTGSGTTGVACVLDGFRFIGIEREPEYHAIATARIEHAKSQQPAQAELFGGAP